MIVGQRGLGPGGGVRPGGHFSNFTAKRRPGKGTVGHQRLYPPRMTQCRLDYFSHQSQKRHGRTTAPVVTGMAEACAVDSSPGAPPRRGIPNFGGTDRRNPGWFPTKIRYTLPEL